MWKARTASIVTKKHTENAHSFLVQTKIVTLFYSSDKPNTKKKTRTRNHEDFVLVSSFVKRTSFVSIGS